MYTDTVYTVSRKYIAQSTTGAKPFQTSTHLPPLHIPASESQRDSCEEDDSLESRPERKRVHHRLLPLFIPSPSPFPVARGAVLFRSQLRSPGYEGDVPYTPPPMLSPIRPGSGLFSSVCGVDGQSPVAVFATRVQLCKTGEHPSLNGNLTGVSLWAPFWGPGVYCLMITILSLDTWWSYYITK